MMRDLPSHIFGLACFESVEQDDLAAISVVGGDRHLPALGIIGNAIVFQFDFEDVLSHYRLVAQPGNRAMPNADVAFCNIDDRFV